MRAAYQALTVTVYCVFSFNLCCCDRKGDGRNVTVAVTRRIDSDLYYLIGEHYHVTCSVEEKTYMVEEKECVKNENLFKDNSRPILHMPIGELLVEAYQQEKDSICDITSLEVVRGLEKAFQIDHSGFSLSTNGTLKVNKEMLAYSPKEYEGELYHIKMSCTGNFFFVISGRANVTQPKFNCTIPGTLYNHSIDCPAPQITTVTIKIDEQGPITRSEVGTGIGILTVLALGLLCICAVFALIYKRKRIKVSAVRSRVLERKSSTTNKKMEAQFENGKDFDEQHMYASPGELVQSNLYGCGGLGSNPAYKEPVVLCGRSEEPLESSCQNPCYDYSDNKEEPVHQEIIPRLRLETTASRSKMDMNSNVTLLYESMDV